MMLNAESSLKRIILLFVLQLYRDCGIEVFVWEDAGGCRGVKAHSNSMRPSEYASLPTSVFSTGFYLQDKISHWKWFYQDLTQSLARYHTQSITKKG